MDLPNMNARYVGRRGRARGQQDDFNIKHHYQVHFFLNIENCLLLIYLLVYVSLAS
jgi:hypothetical protein